MTNWGKINQTFIGNDNNYHIIFPLNDSAKLSDITNKKNQTDLVIPNNIYENFIHQFHNKHNAVGIFHMKQVLETNKLFDGIVFGHFIDAIEKSEQFSEQSKDQVTHLNFFIEDSLFGISWNKKHDQFGQGLLGNQKDFYLKLLNKPFVKGRFLIIKSKKTNKKIHSMHNKHIMPNCSNVNRTELRQYNNLDSKLINWK